MAAITDLLDRVTDSSTGRPIIATLAAPGKTIAASSINLTAATNWTTSSAIHFSVYSTTTIGSTVVKDSTTQTDWKGVLSGTTISNLTLKGGTDRAYTAGAIVELTPIANYGKDLYDWATTGHNQNGTHKAFTESNIVPTAALQNNSVTPAKLGITKVTDANGWACYDYGTFKKYTKTYTGGATGNIAADQNLIIMTNAALPVGMANRTGTTMQYTFVSPAAEFFAAQLNLQSTAGLTFLIHNSFPGPNQSSTGWELFVEITT